MPQISTRPTPLVVANDPATLIQIRRVVSAAGFNATHAGGPEEVSDAFASLNQRE